jgi:hypothetical protein
MKNDVLAKHGLGIGRQKNRGSLMWKTPGKTGYKNAHI